MKNRNFSEIALIGRGVPNEEEARFSSDGAVRLGVAYDLEWLPVWLRNPAHHSGHVGRDRLARLFDTVGFCPANPSL